MATISSLATSILAKACYRSALAALKQNGGKMHVHPGGWVPDEYETLERAGLARCDFGRSDPFNRNLKARDISLTEVGERVAGEIVDAVIPPYVTYSFHSALIRAHPKEGAIGSSTR